MDEIYEKQKMFPFQYNRLNNIFVLIILVHIIYTCFLANKELIKGSYSVDTRKSTDK